MRDEGMMRVGLTMNTINTGPAYQYRLIEGIGPDELRDVRWNCERKLQKNVVIVSLDGDIRKRVNPEYLVLVADENGEVTPDEDEETLERVELRALVLAEPVLFTGEEGVFVVLAQFGANRYRLAKFGGDANRYWKASRANITPLTVAEAVDRLKDLKDLA